MSSGLRIAILYSHLREFGGVERVIEEQVSMFRRNGYDVNSYFSYVDKKFAEGKTPFNNSAKCLLKLPTSGNETLSIMLSMLLAPLTKMALQDADVLLCHGYGPAPWIGHVLKKMIHINYISYIHSVSRFLYASSDEKIMLKSEDITRYMLFLSSKIGGPILRKIDRQGILSSDKVLANSKFTAKRIQEIYGLDPEICYPPVETAFFKPLREEAARDFCPKLWRPLILYAGRIVASKRLDWLVEALPHVLKTFPSAVAAIVGQVSSNSLDYVRRLAKLSDKLNLRENIKFLGLKSRSDLVKLYNAADVYVSTSPREGFGLGQVEAMSCGTPAVVWDDDSGPSETVVDGKTGFKAQPYDIRDFADKILKAIDIGKSSIRSFSHRYVEERFSAQRHWEVLEKSLKRYV